MMTFEIRKLPGWHQKPKSVRAFAANLVEAAILGRRMNVVFKSYGLSDRSCFGPSPCLHHPLRRILRGRLDALFGSETGENAATPTEKINCGSVNLVSQPLALSFTAEQPVSSGCISLFSGNASPRISIASLLIRALQSKWR